jgi:hypothetical protein
MLPKLPKAIGFRFRNVLNNIERAQGLITVDREMASFRAITGEEEAATALMMAIQVKRYPGAEKFKARNHVHKAAVLACVIAIGRTLQPLLKEYQITFRAEEGRIDLKIPLQISGWSTAKPTGCNLSNPLECFTPGNAFRVMPYTIMLSTT